MSKGFRVFGQRFTFDAYILGQLTAGEEKSELKLPSTPTALFVSSVFGDMKALEFAARFYRENVSAAKEDEKNFLDRVQSLKAEIAKVSDDTWFKCAAGAWLKILGTMTEAFGEGYPLYMRSALFSIKQIQEYLGSYTELKHDTLLYAKQNYAEMGGGAEELKPPPVPKGFVEPNLRFWYEFKRLISFFESGFAKENSLLSEIEEFGPLGEFKKNVELFTTIAEKELSGKPVSEDEYESLRVVQLSDMAKPFDDVVLESDDKLRSGLVADINTDMKLNKILYEANGEPWFLLVLVGNENTSRLTIGLTYNHYEFTENIGKRLTDEEWQDRAYKNPSKLPEKNFWYKDLIPGK